MRLHQSFALVVFTRNLIARDRKEEMLMRFFSSAISLRITTVLLTVTSAFGADLTVTNVEVTQATQTTTNTVPLVAQRSTAVRATITVANSGGAPVANVSGRLHVFVGGIEITPLAGILPINAPFSALISPQRANENDTLNFELLSPTGITASNAVDFRVDLTAPAGVNVTPGSANGLTFSNRTTPLLFFTRINYTPAGLGLAPLSFVQPGVGNAFVSGILPVNDSDPTLYRQGIFPSLTFTEDSRGVHRLDATGMDGSDLLSLLESCRQLIVNSGVGASDHVFLYGWLAGNPIDGNGAALVGGRVAFGNSDPIRGQRSYAHELTHNFGFNHNNQNLDQVGFDVGARLPNNPAGNNTTGRVKPTTLFDIQTPGLLTNQAWVTADKYMTLFNSPTLSAPDAPDSTFSTSVLVVQGVFDPTGQKLVRLKPVFRYPWLSQPTRVLQPPTGASALPYSVNVTTAAGTRITVPFAPFIADDPSEEVERLGAFEVMIPAPADVTTLNITDRAGTVNFGGFQRSATPVTVTIVSPQPGAALDPVTKVVARVSNPTAGALFQAAYSPDGGRSFVPIAVDLTDPNFSFDATVLPPSAGSGLVRLFAGDGLNTTMVDLGNLTTPPGINVEGAVNGASFLGGPVSPGELLTLFGLGIGPTTGVGLQITSGGLVSTLLGGVQVFFDGVPAPLTFARADQVNVVVPYAVADKQQTQVTLQFQGRSSNMITLPVAPTSTAVFALNASGSGQGAILNQDQTVNGPANPADKGSIIAIFANGAGQTNPSGIDGKPAAVPLPQPLAKVTATIGGINADILYAGAAPTLVAGVLQVNARIPPGVPSGNVPVVIAVGNTTSQGTITVAVK
jgi:uncharacterized protein (TIGR03437 family)